MLVLRNAFKSISRSKGRNILIGIIVLTIAVSSCIALSIRNAASEAEKSGLSSMNITASISVDREKIMSSAQSESSNSDSSTQPNMSGMRELMQQYPSLTLDQLQVYADSNYVAEFYYSSSISLNASGELSAVSDSESTSTTTQEKVVGGRGGPGGMTSGDFTVSGYSSESAMTKFISGTSKITSGEMFDITTNDMTCLISSDLATFNGLSVGDTITLSNPNSTTETYDVKIVGIYTNTSTSDSSQQMMFSTSMDPANLICVSYGTLEAITNNSAQVATTTTDTSGFTSSTQITSQLSGTYVFADKANYDSFSEEATSKGLSEYYKVSSPDVENYEASLVPLQNLSNFATTMLYIILVVGAIVLIALNAFNIRERKFEVGVLTAIGIKKGKVAMQFVTELLVITLIAITIGAGIGAVASVPVSNNLLESQIAAQETTVMTQNENFGRPDISGPNSTRPGSTNTEVTYLDEINASTNITILAQLVGIGILLTIISSLFAVVFVLRYEPLKILANRS